MEDGQAFVIYQPGDGTAMMQLLFVINWDTPVKVCYDLCMYCHVVVHLLTRPQVQWHHVVTAIMELVLKDNQFSGTTSIVEEVRETSLSALGPVDLTVDTN